MSKILLALQFWQRDQARAYKLAKLIADWQPSLSTRADFCFVPRKDVEHDKSQNAYVGKKFRTFTHHGRRDGSGWPFGPNELWLDLMTKLSERGGLGYKAVLTFEPDCVPLCKDWIEQLHKAWDDSKAFVVGSILPTVGADGPQDHINGNAMFSCDPKFLAWVAEQKVTPKHGWDTVLASEFRRWGWANTPVIRSDYRCSNVTGRHLDNFLSTGVALHHGSKDETLLTMIQDRIRVTGRLPSYVKPVSVPDPDLA